MDNTAVIDMPELVVTYVREMLERYLARFPHEREGLRAMQSQFREDGMSALVRSTMRGHLTTSALVYDPETDRVLLIHHVIYDAWLPPGGHYELPGLPWDSSSREVTEETGVIAMLHAWCIQHGIPLDIDTHPIPENKAKNEGAHFHHDVTYLAIASSALPLVAQLEEVHEARWVLSSEFARLAKSPRMVRLVSKLEELKRTVFQK
jgi:8-oxo-dGTP pyrophosphatase MutT (NUDIX family)